MSPPSRPLAVSLPVTGVTHRPENSEWACCLNCQSHLDLVQPDAHEPGRFAGIREHCERWYLLDWHHGTGEGVMLLLPEHREQLKAYAGEAV